MGVCQLNALAEEADITASSLIVLQHGNATWGHPLVALEVARWISPRFGVWCNQNIRTLMEAGKVEIAKSEPQDPQEAIAVFSNTLDVIFKGTNIKSELTSGLKLNFAKKQLPELAGDLEESRQLLINNTAQKFDLLTPTEIGKRIGLSGQAVNKKLCEMGFQVKNEERISKKEPSYLPIGCGKEFSELTLATGKDGDVSSYQQLRWYSSVLEQIN